MSFKYTAAALAASSLLVNAAPAPKPSETTQQADKASKYWDPYNINAYNGYGYGSGYFNGYNPFYSYDPNPTPQAEDFWGPNGFDGEAWNNAHRQDPYPGRKRAMDNADSAEHGPVGSVFGDDGDDADTLILISPFSLLNGILPLPDLGALFGDLFGYGGQQAPPRPQVYGYPAPFPKGALPPYAGAYPPFPKGAYPPMPKGMGMPGMPRPRPGAPGGPPIVAPLNNGAGQVGSVGIGLNGGSFSLDPIPAATPQPLNPGSPAGPFPKGWPQVGRPTPAPAAPPAGGIVGPVDGGFQSIGLNPGSGSFDLNGTPSASLPTPAPVPAVQNVPGPAGGIVSAGAGAIQSLGINGGSFTLAPVASPAPAVVPAPAAPAAVNVPAPAAPVAPIADGSAQLGLSGSSTTGITPAVAPAAAASPMAMPEASPAAASPAASPVAAASPAVAAASPAAGTLSNTAGGATSNGALGLGASSATIS